MYNMVEFKRRVGKNVASERFVRQCSLVATIRFDSGNIHFLHTVFFCCSIFLLAAMPGKLTRVALYIFSPNDTS